VLTFTCAGLAVLTEIFCSDHPTVTGSADLDELPTDSLKRIRETYKAFKAVSSSWAQAAAQGDPARISQHSATGAVSWGGGAGAVSNLVALQAMIRFADDNDYAAVDYLQQRCIWQTPCASVALCSATHRSQ
jgi:hypothetical protein